MEEQLIFEGSVAICNELVLFKIVKQTDENGIIYEWRINPDLVDEHQIEPHHGETNRAQSLEELFFRFNYTYKQSIVKVKKKVENPNF